MSYSAIRRTSLAGRESISQVYFIVKRLHSHTQNARFLTCIAIQRKKQIHERRRGYIHCGSIEYRLDGANVFTVLWWNTSYKTHAWMTRMKDLSNPVAIKPPDTRGTFGGWKYHHCSRRLSSCQRTESWEGCRLQHIRPEMLKTLNRDVVLYLSGVCDVPRAHALLFWNGTEKLTNWADHSLTSGVSKLRPAGQMRPAKPFYQWKNKILSKNLFIG